MGKGKTEKKTSGQAIAAVTVADDPRPAIDDPTTLRPGSHECRSLDQLECKQRPDT